MKVKVLGNRKVVASNPWRRTRLGRKEAYLRGNPWPWEGKGASGDLGAMASAELRLLTRGSKADKI